MKRFARKFNPSLLPLLGGLVLVAFLGFAGGAYGQSDISDRPGSAMQVAQAKKFPTRKTGQRRVVRQKTRKLKSLHFEAPALPVKPGTVRFKKLRFAVNAPKIELAIEPQEGNYLVYHPLPGWTSKERRGGQLSVLLYIRNKESKTITLKKVAFVYSGRTKGVSVQKK